MSMEKILVPNFKEGRTVSLDAFIFPVFDGGKYSVEKDTGNGELLSDNIFQCIPASCNEGTDSYKDAPLGISLSTPATIPQIENILKKDKADAMKELEQLVRDSFNASDENKFYFVACDNEFASGFMRMGHSQKDEPFWISYAFFLFYKDLLQIGMVYFNCLETDELSFETVVRKIVSKAKCSPDGYAHRDDNSKIFKDSKIDALYTADTLFESDVLFFNDDEIAFNDGVHTMTGMQMNSAVINNYPDVLRNKNRILTELARLMLYIENNDKLKCPLSRIGNSLHEIMRYEDMTGMTFFNLFAYHLLKFINISDTSITLTADLRVTSDIPDGKEKVTELIRTLLRYNNRNENIPITIMGMRNLDVPENNDIYNDDDCDEMPEIVAQLKSFISEKGGKVLLGDIAEKFKDTHSRRELSVLLEKMADSGMVYRCLSEGKMYYSLNSADSNSINPGKASLTNICNIISNSSQNIDSDDDELDEDEDEEDDDDDDIGSVLKGIANTFASIVVNEITYNDNITIKRPLYTVSVPDGFKYEEDAVVSNILLGETVRDFVAWIPGPLDPDSWEMGLIAFASTQIHDAPYSDEAMDMSANAMKAFNPGTEVNVFRYNSNGIRGSAIQQRIDENCSNFHCTLGKSNKMYQFRVIFNCDKFNDQEMKKIVFEWLDRIKLL